MGSVRDQKPGWMSRVFGIEPARLIACDARSTGDGWVRDEPFTFLYRSRRGVFFVLRDPQRWSVLSAEEARRTWDALPERLVDPGEAFDAEPELEALPSSDDDDGTYQVLVNAVWEYSLWLDGLPIPSGWSAIGVDGQRSAVLDFVRRHCVFGAPDPNLAATVAARSGS